MRSDVIHVILRLRKAKVRIVYGENLTTPEHHEFASKLFKCAATHFLRKKSSKINEIEKQNLQINIFYSVFKKIIVITSHH